MSASNKSWLMLGGLAIVVAGLVTATRQLGGEAAPTAEIVPTTLTTEPGPAAPTRTHFPTILQAKPVTNSAPAASPRYAPRNTALPEEDRHFDRAPGAAHPKFEEAHPTDQRHIAPRHFEPHQAIPPSPAFGTPPDVGDAGNPAGPSFDAPPVTGGPTVPADASRSGTPQAENSSGPITYTTLDQDSFWNISKRSYGGDGRYFKALYYHNRERILRADRIPPGIQLDIPPLSELRRMYPDLCELGSGTPTARATLPEGANE